MLLQKFIRGIGIFLILIFAVGSMFLSFFIREIDPTTNKVLRNRLSFTSTFEDRFYDIRMKKTIDHETKYPEIVLGRVDDESLKSIGRWPWKREVWGQVINKFKIYGAKVLAFDAIFSEPELVCGESSGDKAFKEAIEDFQSIEGNKIILPYSTEPWPIEGVTYKEMPEQLFNFLLDTKQEEGFNLKQRYVQSTTFPIPDLIAAEPGLGYINNEADADGVFRYYPLVTNVDSLYFPSMGLLAFTAWTGKTVRLEVLSNGNANFFIEDKSIHLNVNGETKVRWMGDQDNFPGVSIHKVLNAPIDDQEMRDILSGRLVFIGSTAVGAHDLRNTPINPQLPGVYSHINLTSMLDKTFFYKSTDDSILYSIIILSIGALFLILTQHLSNPFLDLIITVGIVYGSYWIDLNYFINKGYELRLFFCHFSFIAVYSWNTFLNFNRSNKEKKQIKGTFSKYVAPSVVDEMLNNPEKLKVGGEKKDITCLFSDVRDFTSISEKLSPQELSKCLNQYMGKMTDIVFDTQGTLDKYIGDAIVAYWGAPLDVENHPQVAVLAAIDMIDKLPEVNQHFRDQGFPEFKIGIGLNSGECSLGNMGSDKIFSYTALGDNMNLGARLEALCKHYGSYVTISEYTFKRIDPKVIRCRRLDKVRVKGKSEPVEVFEALHSTHYFKTSDEDFYLYEKAYDQYYERNFVESLKNFKSLSDKYPEDKACKRFTEWNEAYIATPPAPDWDGVFTHTTKG